MNTKFWFTILFFGCFGMATEIFFVAFSNLVFHTPLWEEPLWSLTGKTYVWMFPIYALIPVIGGPLMRRMRGQHVLVRLLVYTTVLLAVEFATGWALDMLTGKCPWEYTSGLHLMGYAKLDNAPFWAVFCYLVETLYNYLDRNLGSD